jgi:hypothetical protein
VILTTSPPRVGTGGCLVGHIAHPSHCSLMELSTLRDITLCVTRKLNEKSTISPNLLFSFGVEVVRGVRARRPSPRRHGAPS